MDIYIKISIFWWLTLSVWKILKFQNSDWKIGFLLWVPFAEGFPPKNREASSHLPSSNCVERVIMPLLLRHALDSCQDPVLLIVVCRGHGWKFLSRIWICSLSCKPIHLSILLQKFWKWLIRRNYFVLMEYYAISFDLKLHLRLLPWESAIIYLLIYDWLVGQILFAVRFISSSCCGCCQWLRE